MADEKTFGGGTAVEDHGEIRRQAVVDSINSEYHPYHTETNANDIPHSQ